MQSVRLCRARALRKPISDATRAMESNGDNSEVRCRIFDNEMDVGDGGSRCVSPAPRVRRPCEEVRM